MSNWIYTNYEQSTPPEITNYLQDLAAHQADPEEPLVWEMIDVRDKHNLVGLYRDSLSRDQDCTLFYAARGGVNETNRRAAFNRLTQGVGNPAEYGEKMALLIRDELLEELSYTLEEIIEEFNGGMASFTKGALSDIDYENLWLTNQRGA